MKSSAFKVGEFMAFLLNRKFIKTEHVIYFLVSKKLIHEGEIISSIHMDGSDTMIVERVSSDERELLESPIDKRNFSVRFNQAVRGDSSIKTIQDLKDKSVEELQRLPGFKGSCTKELAAFWKKHDI